MIKYVITVIPQEGTYKGERMLFGPNQGQYFHATPEEAQEKIDAIKRVSPGVTNDVYGPNAVETLEVRATECYNAGDSKTIWFD